MFHWGSARSTKRFRPMVGADFVFSFELSYLGVSRNLV
jgi:hypothetical protein